ncbi:putative acyl-CoA transferase/carnitine dehydratase [Actinobacteria bacterium IMCC26256]|nr:putative acyl-CoA transferase/carnitine dehydratase [Actinobacteria bacterium IMCC26256]
MQALEGLRVVDMATVLAGPAAGKYLADFGADVIKIEAPEGDGTRRMGWMPPDGGDAYMWQIVGRGKRSVVADLKTEDGLALLLRLVDDADVLIENFRPGTMERLGLDPTELLKRNPRLVILRVSGFGQTGPYRSRPGFASIAEAMSGFASLSGEPDGAPLLPPIALTDEVTGIVGAFSIMVALRHRDATGAGQVVDVNLLESILQMMGPLPAAFAGLGYEQPRMGSGIPYSVPRGTYQCADGEWIAISASAESVATRVLELLGVSDDPRFSSFAGRSEHRVELDALMSDWVARRSCDEALAEFDAAHAAAARVYSIGDVVTDPHVRERGVLIEVDGVLMTGPVARLYRTPGEVRSAGPALGADTEDVKGALAETPGWPSRPS